MRDQGTARLVAQGDAATAAGLDPRVGDVVRFDDHAPEPWIRGSVREVRYIRDQGGIGDRELWLGTREKWAKLCEAHGYLIERGEVCDG